MFVDTHCHLNMMVKKDFDTPLKNENFERIGQILKESGKVGVKYLINVGTSVVESLNTIKIAKKFNNVFAAIGIHPCDLTPNWLEDVKKIEEWIINKRDNKIVAVGETGLDFFHKPFDKRRQIEAFKFHVELALKYDLLVVIHMREATDETLKIVEECTGKLRGVFHCFSDGVDIASLVTKWGFYVGIDGHVTYPKNEKLREVVESVSLDKILLETDAPFLPPQQFRGKQNSPAYIPLFADLIAEIKKISVDELADATTQNAKKLFRLNI
ncbi:MAG: TatD family hydrolase [bacterium]